MAESKNINPEIIQVHDDNTVSDNSQRINENVNQGADQGELEDKNAMYGVLIENLGAMKTESNNCDTCCENVLDIDMTIQATASEFQENMHKSVERSYSIESGEILNDKFCCHDTEENSGHKLDLLPAEMFLHICSFLDAKFVINTLGSVCKSFNIMVNDEVFWKVRMGQRWRKKYPAIPVNDKEFNWAEACIEREEQHRLWSNDKDNMHYFQYKADLFAAVDAVHLMKEGQVLAAGSRDRYLTVLDLTKLDANNPKESLKRCQTLSKMNAHKGWIWSISSLNDTLATASWDCYIKLWDLSANGVESMNIKCDSALLCTHFEEGCLIAGGYDKKVYHIDPRAGTIVDRKRYHKKPVLCMAVDDKYVITGSEDKTVVVYDRRGGKPFKTITLESFPMSMSYGMDQLWLGTKSGGLHLVDASDGDFDMFETNDAVHQGKITGIIHGLGSIFTSSTDKTINILEPTQNPGVIGTLREHTADIAGISFQNDILACASSDVSIGIWIPKIK